MSVANLLLLSFWSEGLFARSVTVQDTLGSLIAVIAFLPVLYFPGYVACSATNLFGFRKLDLKERSMWAIAASFCISPVALYLVARISGLHGASWLCIALTAVALVLLILNKARSGMERRDRLAITLLVCGWTLYVLLMLVDFQWNQKLFFSVVTADQSYRIAFTDAIVRTGVPPSNPLYFPGSPAPMRYYYFWYLLTAVVVKICHITSRQAFIASTVWAGLGLIATVRLYTLHFFEWTRKRRWVTIGLLAVMGAGLIPSLGNAILQPSLNGDIEWWSVEPIDAWPDSLLWVPHHVAGVLCCLIGFLLLWRALQADRKTRYVAIVLTAFAFASAFGLSVYVSIGFSLMMVAWLLRPTTLRSTQRNAIWIGAILATIFAMVLVAPFLVELANAFHRDTSAAPAASTTAPAHILSFSVRNIIDSGLLTGLPVFASWNKAHPWLLDQAIRLALLVPGLAMELGLYGAVLVLVMRLKRKGVTPAADTPWGASLYLTLVGLVISLFISSSIISNNDFGYRVVMLPMFFLTLLTAEVLGSWMEREESPLIAPTRMRRRLLLSLTVIGIAGTLYGAFLLRAWLPMETQRPQNGFSTLAADAFEMHDAFHSLHQVAAADAVVSFRPIDPTIDRKDEVMSPNEFYQRMFVMDVGRQMLNAEGKCATQFGGSAMPCAVIQRTTAELYANPAPDAAAAKRYCRNLGVSYLTLSRYDPDWSASSGWPVQLPAVASEPGFRIFDCAKP